MKTAGDAGKKEGIPCSSFTGLKRFSVIKYADKNSRHKEYIE